MASAAAAECAVTFVFTVLYFEPPCWFSTATRHHHKCLDRTGVKMGHRAENKLKSQIQASMNAFTPHRALCYVGRRRISFHKRPYIERLTEKDKDEKKIK